MKRGRTPLGTSAAYTRRQRETATCNGHQGYRYLFQHRASLASPTRHETTSVGDRAKIICVIIGVNRAIRPVRVWRSCLLCVCRRSRLLLSSAAQLCRLSGVRSTVRLRPSTEIYNKLHMAAQTFGSYYDYW